MKKGPKQKIFPGDCFESKNYGSFQIISYEDSKNVVIEFEDNTVVRTRAAEILSGTVKNPNFPTVFGIGFIGQGPSNCSEDGRISKCYNVWSAMLSRCYNTKRGGLQSYSECKVSDTWHNYQNFSLWFRDNYIEDWELDKDFLVKNNKVYSPETCCFLPKELNNIFRKKRRTSKQIKLPRGVQKLPSGNYEASSSFEGIRKYLGVYPTPEAAWIVVKSFVEGKILTLSEKYKSKLSDSVYSALLRYQYPPYDDGE